MKRCPECRRDYYDDTLRFCPADGSELVYGLSDDEPATAILSGQHRDGIGNDWVTNDRDTPGDEKALTLGKLSRRPIIGGAIGILLLAALVGSYYYYDHARTQKIESIAVLPFVNRNNDPDTDYLADGIPESISNSLSQLPDLRVMSRNSVFHYKGKETDSRQVASELSVKAVLNGRVVQRGDGLSINCRFVLCQRGDVEPYQV